jgi:hypothetical protein
MHAHADPTVEGGRGVGIDASAGLLGSPTAGPAALVVAEVLASSTGPSVGLKVVGAARVVACGQGRPVAGMLAVFQQAGKDNNAGCGMDRVADPAKVTPDDGGGTQQVPADSAGWRSAPPLRAVQSIQTALPNSAIAVVSGP